MQSYISVALLQSPVLHDSTEIILIVMIWCWRNILIIINVENSHACKYVNSTAPHDASFNRLFAHDVIAVGVDRRHRFTSHFFLTFPIMNNTFSYTMKSPCVFSIWSIWAFINSAKHRHLEFLLLIPMEKKITSALQLHFARHQNHMFANNLYSALSFCCYRSCSPEKQSPLK